ncbi:TPA: hydrolase [Clostridioides difficile]|nr:hydrolase [Clostridioides difficile]
MNKLNICIDIDGTITSPYHFIPYLNDIFNKNITEAECITHNWEELYGSGIRDVYAEFNNKYIHSYDEAKIVEGATEVISTLSKGHNLSFVTARHECLTDVTKNWLSRQGFSDIDVYLLGSDYKVEKARELSCDIFIEDNPLNSVQLADDGVKVILLDTNYNKDVKHQNIVRVSNWIDIEKIIKQGI